MNWLKSGASALVVAGAMALGGCEADVSVDLADEDETPTVEDARAFIDRAEAALRGIDEEASRIAWVNANFITYDTNWLNAKVTERQTALAVRLANEAKRFDGLELPADVARKLLLLKLALTLPAPDDAAQTAELATITTDLESAYGTGKYCKGQTCQTLGQLTDIMADSRDPAALLDAWVGWRTISPPMKADYARMVDIANQGAKDLGFADLGTMWRSKYDMDPDAFATDVDRLWGEVKPLYDALHCHVRAKLGEYYGSRNVPQEGPIPAHLLGNMWAQQWGNIYELVAPEGADPGYDLTELLEQANYTPLQMVRTADSFFTSVGFDPMPETFYERSLITKPADREVVCHASAWNLDDKEDIRIKMCTKVNGTDFQTVHHELGHNIYQRAYKDQPYLFIDDPNDGFHEAIGDMIALSITPSYLKQIGLLDEEPSADKDIGILLQQAMDKVAFLPFGLLVDKWRWQVFSGELTPDSYNQGWWALRTRYQGIEPPVERTEADFDPGAKFHIPGNTPYMRYFLAHIFQFQFHQAACEIAGWDGPLHRCSIYGNRQVGARFDAMLKLGASQPWQDALEAFTGTRQADGSAILAYFAPLKDWLDEQNAGRQCGW